ncbi:M20/M25/M40 family metallo-hydrolase [Candidatus Bathyarchaeota archaeon]|nr:M20/M25/M40 family metallo-hydrolase [Candidatus Bathyarchaeota archaeon]MBS7613693.1 M20/M25/M40 family metallo-hydrolase [Candidatus Bathyarchaeota archaeon]MBS7618557.1 M20/M25/M40 family metallo-hydrolase [Candidatus Bathyarchaeota archaeon]
MHIGSEFKAKAVDILKNALKIYSPSLRETELAFFLMDTMKKLGYDDVYIDDVGNVLGSVSAGKSKLMYVGHMDTVPGIIPYREEGGFIYARGAVDAKSALIAMIVAGASLKSENLNGKLTVACTVDEEGSSLGFKHILRKGVDVKYVVFGEPGGVEVITIAYRGRVQLSIKCKTRSGHAGSPWAFENAVENLYEFYEFLKEKIGESYSTRTFSSRYYTTSTSITWIKGGETSNIIPDFCEAKLDIRIPPHVKAYELIEFSRKLSKDFTDKHLGVQVEVEPEEYCDAYEANKSSMLLNILRESIKEVRGKHPKLIRKTSTGDMNLLAGLPINAVTYGPGDSTLSHTDVEKIDVEEYLDSIEVYRLTALKLLKSC